MTLEDFANAVNELILKAKEEGLDEDEIGAELEGILAGMKGE